MSKYYIVDSTRKQNNKNPVFLFDNVDGVIKHLEGMCARHFQRTRKTYMENAEGLGFGGDETTGRSFYEQMAQYFNIGVIRSDSTPVQCNIFDADKFKKSKDVHGN